MSTTMESFQFNVSLYKKLIDRLRFRNRTVQYELHRMTHKGGWKDYGGGAWGERLSPDTELIGDSEGRFRLIRRVDGRIQDVIWTRDTPDADAAYEQERKRDEQRELMRQLSLEDLHEEWINPDRLSALPRAELHKFYMQKREQAEQTTESSQPIDYPEIEIAVDEAVDEW